jgi:hypothetical protein
MTRPQCSQRNTRVDLGSVGFTARQVEHVFEEGNQRSATTSRPPFQRVL